jgi:hypothetical protein
MTSTSDSKTVQKLRAELAQEKAEKMKLAAKLGGVNSLNTKLRNLVLRYRDAEAKQKATHGLPPSGGRSGMARYGRRPRRKLALPEPQRAAQPFLWDAERGYLIAPWPRPGGALPAPDQQRLDAVAEVIARLDATSGLWWLWPDLDRLPQPVGNVAAAWVAH